MMGMDAGGYVLKAVGSVKVHYILPSGSTVSMLLHSQNQRINRAVSSDVIWRLSRVHSSLLLAF